MLLKCCCGTQQHADAKTTRKAELERIATMVKQKDEDGSEQDRKNVRFE
jgi:hypothetical protein